MALTALAAQSRPSSEAQVIGMGIVAFYGFWVLLAFLFRVLITYCLWMDIAGVVIVGSESTEEVGIVMVTTAIIDGMDHTARCDCTE